MTKLSVNINKIALLRNARGANYPNVCEMALLCEKYGAEGITVHPRPDERHIRYKDVMDLKPLLSTEFNIEGYPSPTFIDLVLKVKPHQVTLVPDAPDALTSSAGWDCLKHATFLLEVLDAFCSKGIRTSLFIDTDNKQIEQAAKLGADRIELYTGPYAERFAKNPESAIKPYVQAAQTARKNGLSINAGHDLNLQNLPYFKLSIPYVEEVSIGHALIVDALHRGLENSIQSYKNCLK
ncbi:MAG: pyridoxine 5'-phosphate synthase [Bacteroidales bacterium]|nr:pyridoxine 5'-phosphate synthase [Bacteroidales bacterium]MDD4361014.1 pyridoxine 5'-phosphate synthase [Bacteroidales bacterium]MDD4430846.1 pyridoxine 5'-phosphate synthase [Bacteroidales bacterium]